MSINIIPYQAVFQQIYLQFCFDSYTFIFWLFSSDIIQVLMSVCPTVSVLRFNGCCHPCCILVFFTRNTFKPFFMQIMFISHININITRMTASYYRQLSADLKIKKYKIKTSFVRPEVPKAWTYKTWINSKIYFNIHGKLSVIRCYACFFSMVNSKKS